MNCYQKMIKESNSLNGTISYYGTTIAISKFINYVDNFAYSLVNLGFRKGGCINYLFTYKSTIINCILCL